MSSSHSSKSLSPSGGRCLRSRISSSGMWKWGVMPQVDDAFGCAGGGWVRRWGRERRACALSLIVFGAGRAGREGEGCGGREDMEGGGHTGRRSEDATDPRRRADEGLGTSNYSGFHALPRAASFAGLVHVVRRLLADTAAHDLRRTPAYGPLGLAAARRRRRRGQRLSRTAHRTGQSMSRPPRANSPMLMPRSPLSRSSPSSLPPSRSLLLFAARSRRTRLQASSVVGSIRRRAPGAAIRIKPLTASTSSGQPRCSLRLNSATKRPFSAAIKHH